MFSNQFVCICIGIYRRISIMERPLIYVHFNGSGIVYARPLMGPAGG